MKNHELCHTKHICDDFSKKTLYFLKKNAFLGDSDWYFFSKIELHMTPCQKLIPKPKTYVLWSNKKNKIFFRGRHIKKITDGVSPKPLKNNNFVFRQKFLADFSVGNFKNRPNGNFGSS